MFRWYSVTVCHNKYCCFIIFSKSQTHTHTHSHTYTQSFILFYFFHSISNTNQHWWQNNCNISNGSILFMMLNICLHVFLTVHVCVCVLAIFSKCRTETITIAHTHTRKTKKKTVIKMEWCDKWNDVDTPLFDNRTEQHIQNQKKKNMIFHLEAMSIHANLFIIINAFYTWA